MTDDTPARGSARNQIILIAIVFFLPLLAATWLYYGGSDFRPTGRSNHGLLLQPIVSLEDELRGGPLREALTDTWALVLVQHGACDEACESALYKQRQVRLMLGNDMSRVLRVLLHGPEAPDTLFLEREHAGLVVLEDRAASELFAAMRPRGAAPGGLYLVDPLGNVVLYFPADIAPNDLVEDLEHLLDLSRIG